MSLRAELKGPLLSSCPTTRIELGPLTLVCYCRPAFRHRLELLGGITMLTGKEDIHLGSTETWSLKNRNGKAYDVNIGFPRDWANRELALDQEVPIMYGYAIEIHLEPAGVLLYIGLTKA